MPPDDAAPAAPKVVVVDADERVRGSLGGLLAIGGRVEVVGAAGDPRAALALVRATRPDVVVVDPRLPTLDDGVTFLRRLREEAPSVRIVVLGSSPDDPGTDPVVPADVVVRKTFRPTDLVAAILASPGRG